MLTFRKFLLEYATHSPESKRKENESNYQYRNRLFSNPAIKEEFKRYLMEDCLRSLESIKYLNNEHVNTVIDLIKKWLSDPSSVKKEEFMEIYPYVDWEDTSSTSRATAAARASAWAAATTYDHPVGISTLNTGFVVESVSTIWNVQATISNASAACAYAALAINPNINEENFKYRKRGEYIRVAKILLSQHTENKPMINKDNKKILISTVQNEDKHGIATLLQDYLFPEFEEQMKEFEEYLKELYKIKGELSLEQLVSLIIKNKNEFILFINKFIL